MPKVPAWFYVIAVVGFLWNIVGAAAVIMNFMITPELMASLPPEQQQLYADTPMWSSFGSLVAVATGALGCLALLIKKAWAYPLFIISLMGLLMQDIGIFLLTEAVSILGETILIMQGFVGLIAIGLLFLARHARKKAWIK